MKIKNNNRQRYNSIQGLRSFKDTLPTKVKKIIVKKGEIYSKTLENWKYLVGDKLFKICYPKSFKKINQKNKCLLVMVQRGFEVELEYSKQKIIDKINYFFGKEIINIIKLKTLDKHIDSGKDFKNINATKSSLKLNTNNIKNSALKNSLSEFMKVYKQR